MGLDPSWINGSRPRARRGFGESRGLVRVRGGPDGNNRPEVGVVAGYEAFAASLPASWFGTGS